MKIGIYGGSFNPVHPGHLKLATYAFSELNLDEIIFVPSFITPLKNKSDLLPASVRARLLKRAIKKYPWFSVSDYEIKKRGVSYTVDTLKYFKKKYGADAVLYFLAGADTLENIFRWKSLGQVLKLCRFAVMTRPGYALKTKLPGAILLPMDALDISSTAIRGRLKKGDLKSKRRKK